MTGINGLPGQYVMLPVGEATSYVTENVNSGYMADQTVQEPIVNYKNVTYTIVQV